MSPRKQQVTYQHCEHCREKETNRTVIQHSDPCGERGCTEGKKPNA